MGKLINITNKRFGRLTALERLPTSKDGHAMWRCVCDCGNEVSVVGKSLRSGHTVSCGCYQKDATSRARKKHGKSRSKIYTVWCDMKDRCYNEQNKQYADYGGRGITVCERWKNDFRSFFEDVSELPNFGLDGYTINRKNNDGNYEPDNIEWASRIKQNNNTRRNRLIAYNGETHTLAEWSRIVGVDRMTITDRLKRGWSVEKALTTTVPK